MEDVGQMWAGHMFIDDQAVPDGNCNNFTISTPKNSLLSLQLFFFDPGLVCF